MPALPAPLVFGSPATGNVPVHSAGLRQLVHEGQNSVAERDVIDPTDDSLVGANVKVLGAYVLFALPMENLT